MKRLVCIICATAFLLVGCGELPETEDDIREIYQVTFETQELSNDHVGEEWSFIYTYGGERIRSGDWLPCVPGSASSFFIEVTVKENDTYDDVATGSIKIAACDGGEGTTEITVAENRGRYSGNTAVWRITCTVKLLEGS